MSTPDKLYYARNEFFLGNFEVCFRLAFLVLEVY